VQLEQNVTQEERIYPAMRRTASTGCGINSSPLILSRFRPCQAISQRMVESTACRLALHNYWPT